LKIKEKKWKVKNINVEIEILRKQGRKKEQMDEKTVKE
jgi:hypothetical protein